MQYKCIIQDVIKIYIYLYFIDYINNVNYFKDEV